MFLLGHLGIGLGLAWLLSWKSPTRIDCRFVLFGAILPDLIDKPLAYVTGLDSRLWAHTFLFLFAILALSFVPMLRGLRLVGFGVATHLLLDLIWNQPAIVLYPRYGWSFPTAPFNVGAWFDTLRHDPYVQAGEIVGFVILTAFAWVHGIRSWKTLREFVVHGVLP
ncbi:MAG TPA: metal-dependent hydrolase [Thermoplasmata archaeon]